MDQTTYRALLDPRSVAIIGASDDSQKSSGRPQSYLARYGYEGRVLPINPTRQSVQGLRSYSDLAEIDGPIDLAVVLTPASRTVEALRSCVTAGVPAVIMIPSGFAELDDHGARRQDELRTVVQGSRTRVLGPNCLGVINSRTRLVTTINTGMDQDRLELPTGSIGLVTQSGAIGSFLFNMAQTRDAGLTNLVATGNEMDITLSEVLMAMIEDEQITGVVGYIEGIRDGDLFLACLERARDLQKPLGFLKVGRSTDGQSAVASHTGALAGSDAVYDGVFEQHSVVRLRGMEEAIDWVQTVNASTRPRGNRVTIITTSGGGGALAADYCADFGLRTASWSGRWADQLSALLPEFLAPQNPVDMGAAGGDASQLGPVMELAGRHPDTDVILVLIGNLEREETALTEAIAAASQTTSTPLVVAWVGGSGEPARALARRKIPAYSDPQRALRAIAGMLVGTADGRDHHAPATRQAPEAQAILSAARATGATTLNEVESKRLLAAFGLPVVAEKTATGPEECAAVAAEIGYPVVVKLLSDQILHKSEIGGVALNLRSAEEVRDAAHRLLNAAPEDSSARLLVQPMIAPGIEFILGIKRDAVFGPIIVFGAGGVATEVLEDVQLRTPHLSADDVRAALSRLRTSRLLDAFRGQPARDREAIVSAVLALAACARQLADELVELDVNPLIVGADGQGAVAVDAVVVLAEGGDSA